MIMSHDFHFLARPWSFLAVAYASKIFSGVLGRIGKIPVFRTNCRLTLLIFAKHVSMQVTDLLDLSKLASKM